MTRKIRQLPLTASVAIALDDGKLHAPSAKRNITPIIDAIRPHLPQNGCALELASGTGEHVLHHAAAFPEIVWQPTEIDAKRRQSIQAWCTEAELKNVKPAKYLDASAVGWADDFAGQDVIILSNLLHLIGESEARIIVEQSAKALNDGGVFIIYGPFLRGDSFASAGDAQFHQSLFEQDADIGYKSFQLIQKWESLFGLSVFPAVEMPANNLLLVAKKQTISNE